MYLHAPGRPGFTLIELMIVVSVLAILAAVAIPRFQSVREQAESVAAGTSMVALAKAAEHYHATQDDWPADKNRRTVPPELMAYLPNDDFKTAPIGGVWDFEDWRGRGIPAGGDDIGVAISIVEGDPDMHVVIDREIDDGDLETGKVRYCKKYPRLVYILRFD